EGQGRYWTVDPIDGTKGFIRGDQYAVALALLEQNEAVVAVLGCPNMPVGSLKSLNDKGCVLVAVKGEGAVIRGMGDTQERAIRASDVTDPSHALLCESFESSHVSHEDSARVSETLGIKRPHIRMDSQCKYGLVARGEAALYLRITPDDFYLEKMWDHAAGALIVQEAGGKVTDLTGRALDFSAGRTLTHNHGIIASNGRLHERVLEAIQSILP
ncbi:MAG: inositol monophosphatase family protein, partial [Deltaproteobacteria bacterium]|nr:inositol monophosphatase family protein [Deltaproteobacteria bacterium]